MSTTVWVCTEAIELVRADQMTALYAATSDTSDVRPAHADHLEPPHALICADLKHEAPRTITLARCHPRDVIELLGDLTHYLATAEQTPNEGTPTYLHIDYTAGKPTWTVAARLPDQWPTPPDPGTEVVSGGTLATDEALQALREKLSGGE